VAQQFPLVLNSSMNFQIKR